MKTAWSDKAVQYTFMAGPGDPLELSDRITEFRPYSVDFLLNKKDIPSEISLTYYMPIQFRAGSKEITPMAQQPLMASPSISLVLCSR
jgi:hypothetical protein